MPHIKNVLTLVGLAALTVGGFEAAHTLPRWSQLIETYRTASASAPPVSMHIQPAQWSPGQSLPLDGTGSSGPTAPAVAPGSYANSYNWAGMVQSGTAEKSIQATWTAPSFVHDTSIDPRSSVAEWIGLGGMQSKTLIQIGTITTPNQQGQAVTTIFWEELPKSAVQRATVPTGAVITAKISPSGTDEWRLTLAVKGDAHPLIDKLLRLAPNQAAAIQTSADWITEAPTTNHRVVPLAPVAATTMTHVKANGVPFDKMNPSSLQTVGLYSQTGQLLAEPVSSTGSNKITVDTAYGTTLPNPGTGQQSSGDGTWVIVTSPGYGDGYGGGYASGSGQGYGFDNGNNGYGYRFNGHSNGGGYGSYGGGWGYGGGY